MNSTLFRRVEFTLLFSAHKSDHGEGLEKLAIMRLFFFARSCFFAQVIRTKGVTPKER